MWQRMCRLHCFSVMPGGEKYSNYGFQQHIGIRFFKNDIVTVDVRIEEMGRRLVKSVVDRVNNPTIDLAFHTLATYPRF